MPGRCRADGGDAGRMREAGHPLAAAAVLAAAQGDRPSLVNAAHGLAGPARSEGPGGAADPGAVLYSYGGAA